MSEAVLHDIYRKIYPGYCSVRLVSKNARVLYCN